METARVWSSGGNNWGRSRELHVDRAVPVDEIHRSVWKEDRSAMNPTGDDVGILSKRIDELTATVNRLSRLFSEYVYPEGSKRGGRTLSEEHRLEELSGDGVDFSKDENEVRGNWTGRLDFLLSCLGYAVGLGNVWRFPYLCYQNGGAVFFIPYLIMLIFIGMPIFLLELSLGQYTSNGPLTSWEMAPIFKGLGVGMMIASAFLGIYYNVIIAWSFFYLFASFTSDLPWQHCDREYNTEWCADRLHDVNLTSCVGDLVPREGVCWNSTTNVSYGILDAELAQNFSYKAKLPSEEYLNNYALGIVNSPGLEDLGALKWQLCLCLLLAWIIVGLSIIKGVKSSGKVVYFTAIFPYVVLVILLVRGVTLPGYFEGIRFYILNIDFERLRQAKVWKDAAIQIFFSLSDGFGGLIALASYNRFHNDVVRDSIIVSVGNCVTSFFAGFVIFSSLGFLAGQLDVPVKDATESGVGLAFVVYPAAIARMPVPTLWAILFFLMLITLGLDSEFALIETVTTCIMDQWPKTRKRKWVVVVLTCLFFFLLGLPMCTEGGAYLLTLMDSYSVGWNVLLIALGECICIAWVYGVMRYKEDIRVMLANKGCSCFPWDVCAPWWMINWAIITPALIIAVMIFGWIEYKPLVDSGYAYPLWANVLGWLMTLFCVVAMFVTGAIVFIMTEGNCMQRVRSVLSPSKYWGPALVRHRRKVKHLKNFVIDPRHEEQAGNRNEGWKFVQPGEVSVGHDNEGYRC